MDSSWHRYDPDRPPVTGKEKIWESFSTSTLNDPTTVAFWNKVLWQEISKPSLGIWTGFMFYESPVHAEPEVFVIRRLY